MEEKSSRQSKDGVSIVFAKIESWLVGGLCLSILLLTLSFGTFVSAASQDSWYWRLDSERLTEEALTIKAQTQGQLYRVKGGDTLWRLSRDLGVDLEVLAAMNYLSPGDIIYAGQQIRIPVEPDKTYQVRSGDTLWDIAQRYEVDVNMLMEANRITQPKTLQVGRILTIPGSPRVMAVQGRVSTPASRLKEGQLYWPLQGRITSAYGKRGKEFHHGMDIGGKTGDPVRAALSGTVRFAGYKNRIYGNTVEVLHDNELVTVYAHNSKNLVKKGQRVTSGQKIAEVGSTGRTTGPHLHFEVRVNDQTEDPLHYLK